jgi:hypothetical protein
MLLRDETSTLFPTISNPTTRTSSVPRSLIFFAFAHVHHFISSYPLYPHIWFKFSCSLALKGKQPLEEVLSLTILVLIVLAIPIAPLYMLYERLMRGESFMKNV